ncbi:MAG: AraC family transcriptional regulator [Planctomycetota bacterium]|jgi:AraC-like DNA-binding protein|nr:AraC family transcriptional regulator [Planctomycetota bacterium]
MDDRSGILAAIDNCLGARPIQGCLHAHGRAAPVPNATLTRGPRFILAVAGSGQVRIPQGANSAVYELSAGQGLAVDPGCWHHYHTGRLSIVGCFIHSDCVQFNRWTRGQGDGHPRHKLGCSVDGLPASIHHTARAIADLKGKDPRSLCCLFEALFRQAAQHLRHSPASTSSGRALWQAISNWIDLNLNHAIDRNMAAQVFAAHPNHITRVFAQHGPAGFTATLIDRRCQRAADLLHRSTLPIAEIGAHCGYADPSAFAHAFKKWSGSSPRDYREQA